MLNNDVRRKSGVPVAADFSSADGTPIVIDITTGLGYTLNSAGAVTAIGSGGGGGGVSDGDKGDIVVSGSGTVWSFDSSVVTAAGRALLDDASAAAQRTTLGLGSAATAGTGDFDAAGAASSAVAAHEAAADPHPQYALESALVSGAVAVTVPQPGRMEWQETVSATGVTAAHRVLLSVGAHADSDENSAELLDVSAMEATAGTNQIAVAMSFAAMTAGVIRLNYLATA